MKDADRYLAEMKNFQPAFPVKVDADDGTAHSFGMSLRDYFAGQALIGMLSFDGYVKPVNDERPAAVIFASNAYEIADAMLSQREKDKNNV